MTDDTCDDGPWEVERYELRAAPRHYFAANRRDFVQTLGAGLAVAVTVTSAHAQRRGGRGRGGDGQPLKLTQRFQFEPGRNLVVFTSKVEVGQGSRMQISQAVAEEMHMHISQINVVMGDTDLCPDDGGTAGSRTTPATVPAVRKAAAALYAFLLQFAAEMLGVDVKQIHVAYTGRYVDSVSRKAVTFTEMFRSESFADRLAQAPAQGEITPVSEWEILGKSSPSAIKSDFFKSRYVVNGMHKYPSDIRLPGIQYGKVLNPPSFGAKLTSIDLAPAEAMEGVTVVRDGEFVGCVAPSSWLAGQAVEKLAEAAEWEEKPQVSSDELLEHFVQTARYVGTDWQGPRFGDWSTPGPDQSVGIDRKPVKQLEVAYTIPYIQHAPMEPRAAVAEWKDGKLTVWTGSQQPGRVKGELQQVFRLGDDQVRVIVPDTGGGFGGKHTGEVAVEAARLAKASGRPVSLRWTREEEFTWAYFRPAGLIEVQARVHDGHLVEWFFSNYNSGGSALSTPYGSKHKQERFVATDSPLRQGSYRALASTANTFARESAMDELAELAGVGPLEFRLDNLDDGRLKNVLLAATEKFKWPKGRTTAHTDNRGIGLACGTEKGSFVAACVEVEVVDKQIKLLSITQAFECGAIQNPANLKAQVEGCIVMGLGGALTEEITFRNGKVTNASFSQYAVPRMADVPEMDIVLVDRKDLPSVGAGETPIIAIAPAIANAVFDATGKRLRSLPLRLT